MARIKNQHLENFKAVTVILQNVRGSLSKTEKQTASAFAEIVSELEKEHLAFAERNRKALQAYRATPEGYERSKKSRRESAARTRAKKKAQKEN